MLLLLSLCCRFAVALLSLCCRFAVALLQPLASPYLLNLGIVNSGDKGPLMLLSSCRKRRVNRRVLRVRAGVYVVGPGGNCKVSPLLHHDSAALEETEGVGGYHMADAGVVWGPDSGVVRVGGGEG